MERNLTEMNKLEMYLDSKKIRYERTDTEKRYNMGDFEYDYDIHQIIVGRKSENEWDWDAICQRGSYGCEEGYLEIMGTLVNPKTDGDSVVGWLTAEDVIARIEAKEE